MKNVLSLLLSGCLIIGISSAVLASEQRTAAADVVGILSGSLNVEYEKPFENTGSLLIGVSLIDSDEGDTSYNGFGFSGSYRRYINDKMNYKAKTGEGFFVQGNAAITCLELECRSDDTDETYLSIGGMFGFKYIFDGGFMAEAAAGPVYVIGNDFHDYEVEGIDAAVSLKVGYTW